MSDRLEEIRKLYDETADDALGWLISEVERLGLFLADTSLCEDCNKKRLEHLTELFSRKVPYKDLQAENVRLREALLFYSNPRRQHDKGKIARRALGLR